MRPIRPPVPPDARRLHRGGGHEAGRGAAGGHPSDRSRAGRRVPAVRLRRGGPPGPGRSRRQRRGRRLRRGPGPRGGRRRLHRRAAARAASGKRRHRRGHRRRPVRRRVLPHRRQRLVGGHDLDPSRHRRMRPTASPRCATRRTAGSGTPSSPARTADRATPSSRGCPTTARRPRWSTSRSAHHARPSTTIRTSRRFHAQPTACPDCGPTLDTPIPAIVDALTAGRIVALKGIGGYHLACDARSVEAVARLRRRKGRGDKPFALMARDLATAASVVGLDRTAVEALDLPGPSDRARALTGRGRCSRRWPRATGTWG